MPSQIPDQNPYPTKKDGVCHNQARSLSRHTVKNPGQGKRNKITYNNGRDPSKTQPR